MRRAAAALLVAVSSTGLFAQAPITYRITFPEPQHHWMQVEATFPDLPEGRLELRIARSSPGRYALHEFAKNVYDVQIDDGAGGALEVERPGPSEWNVARHTGSVRARYKVFGDHTDGTYLGIDPWHAHINIPAALMWARGLENRAVRVTFVPAPGTSWKAATQLHPTEDPQTFTAANLQYLVDSPVELSSFVSRTFKVEPDQSFRIALHHDGTDREADEFATDIERIVREAVAVFGEAPAYEGGVFTLLADFLPSATRDGMEHRNSTVLTSPGPLGAPEWRFDILSTAAHEILHSWNVERIRPRSLEPFRLDEANPSGELLFAEGFTSYYEPLILQRTGLANTAKTASTYGAILDAVINSPARSVRSAEEMSRLAPLVDAAVWNDPTNWGSTFLSYYTWGAAIGLGLDLSLRVRSDGRVTLDDYMRRLWREYGRGQGPAEGLVSHPYTREDLVDRLADVSGDPRFANEFFARYISGHGVVDYRQLLGRAGFLLQQVRPGRAWIGPITLSFDRGQGRIAAATMAGTPAYVAGLDRDDELVSFGGQAITSAERLDEILGRHSPGDRVRMTIRRRTTDIDLTLVLEEDPRLELVPAESTGRRLTNPERAFRDAWLASKDPL